MKNPELWHCFDRIQLSEEEQDTVLRWVLHPEEGENPVKKVFAATRLVAVALIVCLITATVCVAANVLRWNEKFFDLFQPTQSQMEELQGATSQPQASVTRNGVTVTVRQTLADQHGVYVLCDVEGPKDLTLTEDMKWEKYWLEAEYQADGTKPSVYGLGSCGSRVVGREGNLRSELFYRNGNGILQNQKLVLTLENLGYDEVTGYDGAGQPNDWTFRTVAEGTWTLTWDFTYENLTKTIPVNETVVMPAGPIAPEHTTKVLTVEVSPISLWVTMEGPSRMGGRYPVITFRDGTQLTMNRGAAWSSYASMDVNKEGGVWFFSCQFDKITDMSDIVCVTWGSLTIPIA